MDDSQNPYAPRPLKVRDPHRDAVLLRDLEIINAQTRRELGLLPPGGLPVVPKRKPLQTLRDVTATPSGADPG